MRTLVVLAVLGVSLAMPQQAAEQPKWYGPFATIIPAGVPGGFPKVADTIDVTAARDQFFKTYEAQVIATLPKPKYKWTGPMAATHPASVPGALNYVPDTAEVAAARQAFFTTFQRQAAVAAPPTPTKN